MEPFGHTFLFGAINIDSMGNFWPKLLFNKFKYLLPVKCIFDFFRVEINHNVDFDDVGVFGSWKQIKVRVTF